MSDDAVHLYLLRHGEVLSHRGDVPITPAAVEQAGRVGAALVAPDRRRFVVLSGETKRARDTAEHVAGGIRGAGGDVVGPTVAHALRNPDLYLSGVRVNMVSSADALAAQVDGLEESEVDDLDFFPQFFAEKDRIGWWLTLEGPPGEGASEIAERIRSFALSFLNPFRPDSAQVVAVTHSPLLRAVGLDALGEDIGEPPWISGLRLAIGRDGTIETSIFSTGEE